MRRLAFACVLAVGCATASSPPVVVRSPGPPPLLLGRDPFGAHDALAPITTCSLTTSAASLLRVSANFTDTPLPLAVGFLSDVTGVTLKVSPLVEHVQVSAQLREVSLHEALETLAAQAGLELHALDECVLLTPRGAPEWVRERHDARDVVGVAGDLVEPEALIATVRRRCGPDAWTEPAAIAFEDGHLVVVQTPALQLRVREVLSDLRRNARLFVSLQVTSLEASDEALSAIGVEFPTRIGCRAGVRFEGAPLEPFQVRVIRDAIEVPFSFRQRSLFTPVFTLAHLQRGHLLVRRLCAGASASGPRGSEGASPDGRHVVPRGRRALAEDAPHRRSGPEQVELDVLPTVVDETRTVRLDLRAMRQTADRVDEAYATVTLPDGGAALLRLGEGADRRWFFVEVTTISLRDEDARRFKIDDD